MLVRQWITKKQLLHLADEALLALSIAIGCYILLFVLQPFFFLGDIGLAVQDRAIKFQADTRASKVTPPFIVLDIDNANYGRLGYPALVPHSLLGELLEVSASGAPRLIVLDMDIGWPSSAKDDEVLAYTLKKLAARGAPPVVLIRQPFRRSGAELPSVLRPTPFDAIVEGSPNLKWATALMPIDGDGVARRVLPGRALMKLCTPDGARPVSSGASSRLFAIADIQVAACAALGGREAFERLKSALPRGDACETQVAALARAPAMIFSCGGYAWPLNEPDGQGSRVLHTMSWALPEGYSRPQQTVPGRDVQVQEVEVISALDVIDHARQLDPAAMFGGRIVIIGASAGDIGDTFRTSIGVMPGFMVVANAIRSGMEHGPVFAGSGYLYGLLVTVAMTFGTFALWLWCRQLREYGVMVFKYGALVVGTFLWFVVAAWALSSGQVIEFVFPQYLVSAYLLFADSWKSVV